MILIKWIFSSVLLKLNQQLTISGKIQNFTTQTPNNLPYFFY